MKKTVVINVVGLTKKLIPHLPFVSEWSKKNYISTIKPVIPAVTCTAQATYLTGKLPSEHGIVGNGWFYKNTQEIRFWQQSHKLIESKVLWDDLKEKYPDFTVSNMFWWFNMYSTADFSCTPRPQYRADGQKIPDIYTHPASLRDTLQSELGQFPLFNFWGPKTSIKSSKWIADASILTDKLNNPTLTLIYLPHLDYNLQRFGNDFSKINIDLIEIDEIIKQLITYYESVNTNVVLLSEYGITDVKNPIFLNRILRKNDFLAIRIENKLEVLDAGASEAFAVCDHQVAHIYIKDKNNIDKIKTLLENVSGIKNVFYKSENYLGLNHANSGDLIVISEENSWFSYYFWENDALAPDYARMVDIHKKPGYDPVEMILNPAIKFPLLTIGLKLIKKKLGFRTLMDVIPLNAQLIKGSHGVVPKDSEDFPVFISSKKSNITNSTDVYWTLKSEIIST